ncbi:hypothetical protein AC249_AIPGENE27870 [Exaiptasia diaphana]|nr:hypothetical protein AC249_AIPGENE27870 [Exaiptasia diaphana]
MRVFFTDKDLIAGKISTSGKEGHLLNQNIITTIKAYAGRQDLPCGAKKGIAHAMTMSIKNLRRCDQKKSKMGEKEIGADDHSKNMETMDSTESESESESDTDFSDEDFDC